MVDKKCSDCKWLVQPKQAVKRYLCGHPLNDFFYDHFNSSTGDTIPNIRRAMEIDLDDGCNLWEKKKLKP